MPPAVRLASLAALFATTTSLALAARPAAAQRWPPPPDVTREQAAMRMFWPNDPDYGGQWQHWSWVPMANLMRPNFHLPEAMLGTGNNTDRAWGITIGDPRVVIAVIDSGIQWDAPDLVTQAAINPGELPRPQNASGALLPYDADGNEAFDVRDYLFDARIPCGTTLPHPLRACRGADDMPNDPNRNGVLDAGDLIRVFSDGTDGDGNGYVDDISGWDFMHDDNDPYDDTRYGHGTGEAEDSAAETNNAIRSAGGCPRCMFLPLRAGDSFLGDATDHAQAVLYAADMRYGTARVRVVQEAYVSVDYGPFTRAAFDYAYRHNIAVIASAGDENHRHQHVPSTANHSIYVHAVRYDTDRVDTATTFLGFNNCTNYGAQLQLSVAGRNCSSEAVGQLSGITGLVYSAALARRLTPELSAEEARQLLIGTVDDINIPESLEDSPNRNPNWYPSLPGWDQRFGYGRVNARGAVEAVQTGRIPPEVDLTSPQWFATFHPDRPGGNTLRVVARIAAPRTAPAVGGAQRFDYTIEWARGIEPFESRWMPLRRETNVTGAVDGPLAELDLSSVMVDNPGEIENRYTISVRIRAVAHYPAPIGDVRGEARRAFYVVRDPDVRPGFPIDLGASGESSPKIADLNEDGRGEIVLVTADGRVHAFQADGTELAGWPARTIPPRGLDPARTPNYRGAPAYSGAGRAIDPDAVSEHAIATPTVADLDDDGHLEVVIATYQGTVHVFNRDGTPYGHGFPRTLPDVTSGDTNPRAELQRAIFSPPVAVDLNNDRVRELVFTACDGKLYALDSQTAMDRPGFPVDIHFTMDPMAERNRAFGAVGVGNFDGDNIPDLVAVSNERLGPSGNHGAIYLVHGDGNLHAGGPYHPNWPIAIDSQELLPMIAEGVSSSPAIADLDGDGRDELALQGTVNPVITWARGAQPPHAAYPDINQLAAVRQPTLGMRGSLSNTRLGAAIFLPALSLSSFGDVTGDGVPDFFVGGASPGLATNIASGVGRSPFEHFFGGWNGQTGRTLPGFPRAVEGYHFFVNPTIADLTGDGYAEAVAANSGFYVHAVDACGREPAGWPKFTGHWNVASAAIGDLDADGQLDVVLPTRLGYLYAWRTAGRATGSVQWPTFRHDNANTGNYGTPLDFGVRRVEGQAPITCPAPMQPDAGIPSEDASITGDGGDAGADSGRRGPISAGGGCGCRTAGDTGHSGGGAVALWFTAAAAAAALSARRRRVRGAPRR